MATLTNEERETHLNMTADDRSAWKVFSDDPVMIARLDKISTAYKSTANGRWYRLTAGQVTLKKERAELSDEERQRRRETMAKALRRSI